MSLLADVLAEDTFYENLTLGLPKLLVMCLKNQIIFLREVLISDLICRAYKRR